MSETVALPRERLELRPQQGHHLAGVLLGLTAIGTGFSLLGLSINDKQFFFSYLTAFVFVMQIALGALFWVLLHHLVDAGWSVVVRRVAENLASVLIYAVPLVLPVLIGMGTLYGWTHEQDTDELSKLLKGKAGYLNVPFFIGRTLFYFAVWAWLAWRMTTLSRLQDETKDVELTRKMQRLAPVGMVLLGLTSAFAGIDWIMTLDFTWFSTMFGVYFWAGAILSSMCAIAIIVVCLRKNGLLAHSITEEHLHDIGKLIFAFTIFWAYITFSQYFLTWYADMPEETTWFSNRRWVGHDTSERHLGSWHWVGVFIVFGHVIVPFLVLLPRTTKRNPTILGSVAAWVLVVHFLELHYQIMPSSQPAGSQQFRPTYVDLATLLALVGATGFVALRTFKSKPLLAKGDPRLRESLLFQNI